MILKRLYWSGYAVWHSLTQFRASYRSPAALRRDRDRRVRRMVRYAYRHVPYYRDTLDRLKLSPADFRTYEDLEKLPLISSADLQEDASRFCSDEIDRMIAVDFASSGSTGQPKIVRQSLAALVQNAAHARRELVPIERAVGKRSYTLLHMGIDGAAGPIVRSHLHGSTWVPHFIRVEHIYADVVRFPDSVLEALERERPEILSMYGNTWARLLSHVERTGARFAAPRLALTGGERLPPGLREWLGKGYGLELYSGYQSAESLKIGYECEAHSGYHLNIDLHPIRIVDPQGRALPAGEAGEVVISNLVNRAMVLLNYRLGDIATLFPDPCACGRTLPLCSYVNGRVLDDIYLRDGSVLPRLLVWDILDDVKGWVQWQCVQEDYEHLVVNLVLKPGQDALATIDAVKRQLDDNLKHRIEVRVIAVDVIVPAASGKTHHMVSRVAPAHWA